MHSLRHFYASWLINRKEDGGPGLPAKMVQERLGHASIVMTMDVYGHLLPRSDDGTELHKPRTSCSADCNTGRFSTAISTAGRSLQILPKIQYSKQAAISLAVT
ncbi:MAG: hypothetical protein ACK4QP_07590 [Pseudorhizobium sp.]